MFLKRLPNMYKLGNNQIILPKLNNYISTVNTRRNLLEKRFKVSDGFESDGVGILRYILGITDIQEYMRIYDNDIDLYTYGLSQIKEDLERVTDPVTTGIIRKDCFIYNQEHTTKEIVVPTSTVDPLNTLPMNDGWLAWSKVKPVRLLYTDSQELTFHTYQDQIKFFYDTPRIAIISVDVVALCLQYINFLRYNKENISVQVYLHRYVLMNALLEDLQNIWLIHRYINLIDNKLNENITRAELHNTLTSGIYGYLGHQYIDAMINAYTIIKRVSHGVTPPGNILASFLLSNNKSLTYNFLKNKQLIDVDDLRQYIWVDLIKDLPWLKLALQSYNLNKDFIQTISFKRQLNRDIKLIFNLRPWATIQDMSLKVYIEQLFSDIAELINE